MNLPNLLTLARIPLLFAVAMCAVADFPGAATLAFVFFVLGAVTDWLDGYVARRTGQISAFGKLMDALVDKIFMLGVFAVLLVGGLLPAWALFLFLLILTRELLVTGLRLVLASRGKVLAAEKLGKLKTVMQIVAAGGLLLVPVLPVLDTFLRGSGLAAFVLATILTVWSGWGYLARYGREMLAEEGS